MKEISLFALILKQTKTVRFLLSFAAVFVICSLLLWLTDPGLKTWGDAIWYSFMLVTTIGFGDLTAATLTSRLISVFLGLYGVLAIGFICGVGASWLDEKVRGSESVALMLSQLEHLEDLSDDQVQDLSDRIASLPSSAKMQSTKPAADRQKKAPANTAQ